MRYIFFIFVLFSAEVFFAQSCSNHIVGVVKNMETQEPIFDVSVECFDSNGGSVTVYTNKLGQFEVKDIVCDARYEIVAIHDDYNGFAEVQTVATNEQGLTLYLNPTMQEEYEDEINLSEDTTVYDTVTNKVIEADPSIDVAKDESESAVPTKKLSFYEKKELARKEKQRKNLERIEAEKEVQRQNKLALEKKREEARIAMQKSQAEQEEKDRIELVKRKRIIAEEKRAKEVAEKNELARLEAIEKQKVEAEQERKQKIKREREKMIAVARARVNLLKRERE